MFSYQIAPVLGSKPEVSGSPAAAAANGSFFSSLEPQQILWHMH